MNRRALAFLILLCLLTNIFTKFKSNQKKLASFIETMSQLFHVCVGGFNFVIQQQTASEEKPTRHPVFYMLIRIHEKQ